MSWTILCRTKPLHFPLLMSGFESSNMIVLKMHRVKDIQNLLPYQKLLKNYILWCYKTVGYKHLSGTSNILIEWRVSHEKAVYKMDGLRDCQCWTWFSAESNYFWSWSFLDRLKWKLYFDSSTKVNLESIIIRRKQKNSPTIGDTLVFLLPSRKPIAVPFPGKLESEK